MEKKSGKPPKPLRLLVNLFNKTKGKGNGSKNGNGNGAAENTTARARDRNDNVGQLGGSPPICITSDSSSNMFFPGCGLHTEGGGGGGGSMQLYSEMEALQLSRSDNPFVRQSQDNLDAMSLSRCGSQSVFSGGSHSLMSPEPPPGPGSGCYSSPSPPMGGLGCNKSMEALTEIHSHMVRSPPPTEWPPPTPCAGRTPAKHGGTGGLLSPRSNDSSDGLEMDYPSGNYYTRSHSEEHILSPGQSSAGRGGSGGGLFSPVRGTTPELLMTMSLHSGADTGGGSAFASPRFNSRTKVRRNDTFLTMGDEGSAAHNSPFRNMNCESVASASAYAMSSSMYGAASLHSPNAAMTTATSGYSTTTAPRRSFTSRGNNSGQKKVSGDSFFSSWRSSGGGGRSRRASETHNFALGGGYGGQVDAKSMECLGGGEGALRSPPASRKSLCGSGSVSPRNSGGPTLFTRCTVAAAEGPARYGASRSRDGLNA